MANNQSIKFSLEQQTEEMELEYHPYVYLFPRLGRQEFEDLKSDIAANGQGIPIAVLAGTNLIIDGRHRYEACQAIRRPPKIEYCTLTESQILWKVISLNIKRRHLSESQRAMIAAKIANIKKGGTGNNQFVKKNEAKEQIHSFAMPSVSLKDVADSLNVGRDSVVKAHSILESFPDIESYIVDGDITINDAHKVKDEMPEIKQEVIKRFRLDRETRCKTKNLAQYRKEVKQEIAKQSLEKAVNSVLGIEVSETPRVNFGDVWQMGQHTLTCCDSSTWDAPKAKLAFADPPYNAGVADWDVDFEWKHDWLIDKADLVVVTPGDESFAEFLRKTTMPYKCMIAHWIKNGMSKSPMGYGNHIIAAVFCKESSPYKVTGKRNQNYSEGIIVTPEVDDINHPGRKPLDYMVAWINRLTEPGNVVIDPFLGSGTTLIAAERTGRICHGAEINLEYCAFILGRWMKLNKEIPKKNQLTVDV
ncbi:hypothetical protein F7734_41155 [Scytonema sp. UIC 10036]|uniref:DNA methyltransferase n=1 Tax=Scytonema sp. UIC 10036 TaxID=2304196 RepID=UPI0012DA525E|nr:DNA methyltransferase [Scytonema sp. UIC 10036]MUG98373.1 hypothetical protein [Scytonema sp. UIC 10036]